VKEYKLTSGNRITVKQGDVSEASGDVLVSWCAPTLKHGLPAYYNIMKRAGHQVAYSMMLFETGVKEGDAFTTIPGFVDFNIMVHAITPQNANLFNISFFNIISTLQEYGKENICRDATMEIPTTDYVLFIDNLLLYESQLVDFSFNFVLEEEKNVTKLTNLLDEKFKKNFLKRLFS
jgi:hypothetical protein